MSDGRFDYEEGRLEFIIENLEHDVKFNDILFKDSENEEYGNQWKPETIKYVKMLINEIKILKDLIIAYDYAASGDSSEEDFLKMAREYFTKKG